MSARVDRRRRGSLERPPALHHDRPRPPNLGISSRNGPVSSHTVGLSLASKELKDILERKIEDLSRQLADQKLASRQDKMAVSRLQREITRLKSANKPGKESLSRELERERRVRLDAEHRLTEMTRESDSCRQRLQVLQDEFRKMEEVVQGMMQYKVKVDQVKHEKASLAVTYENNLQKFGGHIAELERENMVLLNEVKKLELQIDSKPDDGRDTSKLLLERLRILEGENSSLVLENEEQRGQYETCLDEIANQVVQALLAQKMLREECVKLQTRVRDLEHQNHQLTTVFQQSQNSRAQSGPQATHRDAAALGAMSIGSSIESMQSTFSEQVSEKQASMLHMNSLSPWLQERLPADQLSLISVAGSNQSTPELHNNGLADDEFSCRTRIETEFPATPSSPKVKRINVFERKCETKRSSSVSSLTVGKRPTKLRTQSTSSLSRAHGLTSFSTQISSRSDFSGHQRTTTSETHLPTHSNNQGNTESGSQSELGSPVSSTAQLGPKPQAPPSRPLSTRAAQSPQVHNTALPTTQEQPSRLRPTSKLPKQSAQLSKEPGPGGISKTNLPVVGQGRKTESGIKMGCQSPVSSIRHNQSGGSKLKAPQSRSPSVPTPSRPSPPASERSQSVNTRIPTTSHPQTVSNSGSNVQTRGVAKGSVPQGKTKAAGSKLVKHTNTAPSNMDVANVKRRVTPPNTGKSTAKHENTKEKTSSTSDVKVLNHVPVSARGIVKSKTIPVPSSGPILAKPMNAGSSKHKGEYRYPRMGTTNLNCSSPKNEDTPKTSISSIPKPSNQTTGKSVKGDNEDNVQGQVTSQFTGQYFYDYSDEDSDFNRPVSKDFSIASTVSLDELLDQTLENIETPLDMDYSSQSFFQNSPHLLNSDGISYKPDRSELATTPTCDIDKSIANMVGNNGNMSQRKKDKDNNEGQNLLHTHEVKAIHDKPDIVKDTEECEQRNMKKSLTISQLPGSDIPGYCARRPKSLILGSKEKKFLYCEYGSSSSADSSSDEEWSYKFSYAKNIKQHEIQSKVAKSLKMGQAKAIEKTTKVETKIQLPTDKIDKDSKQVVSQIPRPNMFIKPLKSPPPPVARKPVRKKMSPTGAGDSGLQRPKSVEICVNTVIAPPITSGQTTCYSYLSGIDSGGKRPKLKGKSERQTVTIESEIEQTRLENPADSSFDDVKVERTGSKDDGYSTMSSDVQPEMMEKYSDSSTIERKFSEQSCDDTKTIVMKNKQDFSSDPDSALESSTHSNDIRNSNLSLSSQNSYSSEDRPSRPGSLGRVKAMKMKFEVESHLQSPERETRISPTSPAKSPLKLQPKSPPRTNLPEKGNITSSKIPMPKSQAPVSPNVMASKSSTAKTQIPTPKMRTNVNKDQPPVTGIKSLQTTSHSVKIKPSENVTKTVTSVISSPPNLPESPTNTKTLSAKPTVSVPHAVTPFTENSSRLENSSKLHYPAPTLEQIRFVREGSYDSSSSASDRGSDLTSLHISEDNMLSDIPEEKDEYESSIGQRSENPSLTSLLMKKNQLPLHHTQNLHTSQFQFRVTLKREWASLDGITRAVCDADIVKQKHELQTADYDEMYDGHLNVDTPLERSASEADIHARAGHHGARLRPALHRPACSVDDLAVEGQVKDILKQMFMQQIAKSAESADKDDVNFTSFVELLIQRGHVLDPRSPQSGQDLSQMAISLTSSLSSKGHNFSEIFANEEGPTEVKSNVMSEQQKRFNSQFYSLCDVGTVGSNKSISENSEPVEKPASHEPSLVHTCKNGDNRCKKCVEESTNREFDTISRQIESLSKTVNELHRSLSSLNSDNNDSGSESNEGDHRSLLHGALGDKEFDGYEWLQDEFYLNPNSGELILGTSPFSHTGASCDWMNDYTENGNHLEDMFTDREGLHEDLSVMTVQQQKSLQPRKGSLLSGSVDSEGNFNSRDFISRRLVQAEVKLKETQLNGITAASTDEVADITQSVNRARSLLSDHPYPGGVRMGTRPLAKEDLRTTPEKDVDDAEIQNDEGVQGRQLLLDSLLTAGSHESLDDDIGVDHVMCHRLLGNNEAVYSKQTSRPGLNFSPEFYTRFGESEQEAVAAFDFLNDMTTSTSSNQSNEQQASRDQIFNTENHGRINSNMHQSTSSNDSPVSPIKKARRKLRPRIVQQQNATSRVPVRSQIKFSSTSPDSANDASCDEFSVSDSCCDSFSSSEDEEVDKLVTKESVNRNTSKTYL